eukprot:TRINITY_DN5929_c0_g1_i2.p1 TRINITY_DN5929_c0_g1~~TRINITY_DN5929_c0_g1_i2.p1  ORF type:complete len:270 (+),score=42.87 TRINITY_DN5929_c0_g1_i2:88-810(+)
MKEQERWQAQLASQLSSQHSDSDVYTYRRVSTPQATSPKSMVQIARVMSPTFKQRSSKAKSPNNSVITQYFGSSNVPFGCQPSSRSHHEFVESVRQKRKLDMEQEDLERETKVRKRLEFSPRAGQNQQQFKEQTSGDAQTQSLYHSRLQDAGEYQEHQQSQHGTRIHDEQFGLHEEHGYREEHFHSSDDDVTQVEAEFERCALCKSGIPNNPVDIFNHTVSCLRVYAGQMGLESPDSCSS